MLSRKSNGTYSITGIGKGVIFNVLPNELEMLRIAIEEERIQEMENSHNPEQTEGTQEWQR